MNRYSLAALALLAPCLLTVALAEAEPAATPFNDLVLGREEMPGGIVAASAVLSGLNLTTTYLNVAPGGTDLSPSWAHYMGVVGGLAGIGLGGTLLVRDDYKDSGGLGVTNLLVGTIATIGSISSIARARKASDTASDHSDPSHVSFAPAFHGGMAPGVGLRLRF